MEQLTSLSDTALLHELHAIVGSHQRVTADLILHLGEVDVRRLHVDTGFPSLFSYCVECLHFSEDEACRRIEAARLARRFPAIYPLLEAAAVSLTVLGLLKPYLTEENHRTLLAGVSGSSVRQAKEWLAARFPRPDVPWSIRKHPVPRAIDPASVAARITADTSPAPPRITADTSPAPPRITADTSPAPARITAETSLVAARIATDASPAPARVAADFSPGLPWVPARARVEPLSQDRFLVKFTASRTMRDKLSRASDLMRHANPTGELVVVLERAVDLLIAELEKKRQGRTRRPVSKPRPAKASHVTHAARREVVAKDGWRCSFVAKDGRRCNTMGFLEFDHEIPRGCGGGAEASNLRILCRAHNRWAAERFYGKAHVARAISDSRSGDGTPLGVRETVRG